MSKSCNCHATKPVDMMIYMLKTGRFVTRQSQLQLASIQRPGHKASNCSMAIVIIVKLDEKFCVENQRSRHSAKATKMGSFRKDEL